MIEASSSKAAKTLSRYLLIAQNFISILCFTSQAMLAIIQKPPETLEIQASVRNKLTWQL